MARSCAWASCLYCITSRSPTRFASREAASLARLTSPASVTACVSALSLCMASRASTSARSADACTFSASRCASTAPRSDSISSVTRACYSYVLDHSSARAWMRVLRSRQTACSCRSFESSVSSSADYASRAACTAARPRSPIASSSSCASEAISCYVAWSSCWACCADRCRTAAPRSTSCGAFTASRLAAASSVPTARTSASTSYLVRSLSRRIDPATRSDFSLMTASAFRARMRDMSGRSWCRSALCLLSADEPRGDECTPRP